MVLNKLISCLYEISIAVVFEVNVFMIKIIKLKIIKIRSENNKYFWLVITRVELPIKKKNKAPSNIVMILYKYSFSLLYKIKA